MTERREVGGTMRVKFDRGWTSVTAKSGKALLEELQRPDGAPGSPTVLEDLSRVDSIHETDLGDSDHEGDDEVDVRELKARERREAEPAYKPDPGAHMVVLASLVHLSGAAPPPLATLPADTIAEPEPTRCLQMLNPSHAG